MGAVNTVSRLRRCEAVSDGELRVLLEGGCDDGLFAAAREVRDDVYGSCVYVRGLIEISSYCKNDCHYCGIRCSNRYAERYRLSPETVIETAENGYRMGFRTFVLQGGEDPYFTDDVICAVVGEIKNRCKGAAITLSLGERSSSSYEKLKLAGADRYLLRHETADSVHYGRLHPEIMSFDNRMRCLNDLKELGYQVGCGFMVGSPYQTTANIIKDLRFLESFKPHMVGIGPFIPHKDTTFAGECAGDVTLTLRCLAIIRLLLPRVLLPATTALGSLEVGGRAKGVLAGANVVMPNLSPVDVRKKYSLYDGKLSTGAESAEGIEALKTELASVGCQLSFEVGHSKM